MNAIAARKIWTHEEHEILLSMYMHATWLEMMKMLPGRSKRAIWNRAHKMGLKGRKYDIPSETRERMAELVRERKPRLGKVVYPVIERDGVPGKCCRLCSEWKPLARFAKHPDTSGGVRNDCTTCTGRWAYANHREAQIKQVRAYQKRHPDRHRIHKQAGNRRRHGQKMAGRGVSASEWRSVLKIHGGLCAYCKSAKADTMDHVMPLSRGGQHDIGNILPACKACNFEKHTMTLEEWQSKRAKESR